MIPWVVGWHMSFLLVFYPVIAVNVAMVGTEERG